MLTSLMQQVDPNDEVFLNHQLTQQYLYWKMPTEISSSMDVNVYAQEYLRTLQANVTNPQIRHLLLDNHVNTCISAEELDMDAFWALVRSFQDEEVTQTYQFIVDARKSTQSGMKAPDCTFADRQGAEHRLSEHFGRVLYIDLWATWCGPCVMEIPYLERLVEHYKDDSRIQFLSISFDHDLAAWQQKIDADHPAWPQYVTNRQQNKELSDQWGVKSIPRFLIINADGTINSADAFRPSANDFIQRMDAILSAQH